MGVAQVHKARLAYFIAVTNASPARDSAPWRVEFLDAVGSTNDEVVSRAAAGALPGLVIATTNQTAGHGRLGRAWVSPSGTGLAMSALVQPPTREWALMPLLAGLAVESSLRKLGVPCSLKWPNDIQIDGLKVAGVLCRALGDAVVVGIGINTHMSSDNLPTPTSTSLSLHGVDADIPELLHSILTDLAQRMDDWRHDGVGVIVAEYRTLCSTIGMDVRVELPVNQLSGIARGIADDGALIVEANGELHEVAAGDVIHVRPAG